MKNIVLSAVAVLAMSSFVVAGGDISPVEEPVVVPEPVITDSGLYLGLAYSLLTVESTETYDNGNLFAERTLIDEDYSEVMIQAGYKFNSYVAVEGRYWFGIEDTFVGDVANVGPVDFDNSVDAWGIYVKPMYPVTDAFDIYALLGYGAAEYSISTSSANTIVGYNTDTLDGFSWGLGAQYSFNDNIGLFIDYVNIYDDTTDAGINTEYDDTVSTWNFGVNYQF